MGHFFYSSFINAQCKFNFHKIVLIKILFKINVPFGLFFKKLSKNVIPELLCSLFCHELHEFSLMGFYYSC